MPPRDSPRKARFASLCRLVIPPLPLIARARARRARIAPPSGTPRTPVAELRRRLLELSPQDGPIHCEEKDGVLTFTWQLIGIPWSTLLFRAKLRRTDAIDVRLDDGAEPTARVRYRVGKVAWEVAAATWMPKPMVSWREPAFPDFGPPATIGPGAPPAEPPAVEAPRTLAALVGPVRARVLAAGWIWQPER